MKARVSSVALAVVGLAALVYGGASLTGRWLGDPPWWRRSAEPSLAQAQADLEESNRRLAIAVTELERTRSDITSGRFQSEAANTRAALDAADEAKATLPRPDRFLRPSRNWISAAVLLAGLGLLARAGWRRRELLGPIAVK